MCRLRLTMMKSWRERTERILEGMERRMEE
jgi:hypothetical protein